jgi:glutathione peroxidase
MPRLSDIRAYARLAAGSLTMTIDRRNLLTLLAAGAASPAMAQSPLPDSPAMSRVTAYAFSFIGLTGDPIRLTDFAGKPIIIVNTASLCGYTPQYTGLEQLYMRFHERGLAMVGVPSNDFGGQEPGGVAEITETANKEYGVTFPLAAKAEVVGPNAHPFYKWAASERPLETPKWNFHKYLVGRDGHIAAVFPSQVEPMEARVVDAVAKQIASE